MTFAQEIRSPERFLGYKPGEQFTPHQRIADYFRYIAGTAKNVRLEQYGTTNEGRPLMAMFISSEENINRLEKIRENNMRLAGQLSGKGVVDGHTPVICWLSFNVHGNEPASSEAAMQVLFDLVNPASEQAKAWLKNTVVVIDPCLNPDGRERYVNFYNSVKGDLPDPNPAAREHDEPWPEGRTNHFYFDLNRDWVWQTQKESQERVKLFENWLPQIHVDYHEQGYNNPYYFAPAAEPFHKMITPWERAFQDTIGKYNARVFDHEGWLYFTRQEYDLVYPSYGDTYPLFNGAIGMTFEQGGIGAGLAVELRTGDTLTLAERIAHHRATALTTIETASSHALQLLQAFKKYYDDSQASPAGAFKTYIVKNNNADKVKDLAALLARNHIQYGYGQKGRVSGYDYFSGKTESYNPGPNDLVINAYQPKSVLLDVLMEPHTFLSDSNTYDITAWSLPYVYGLKTYGLKESLKPLSLSPAPDTASAVNISHPYAYISAWKSVYDVKFLAALIKKGIKVRCAEKPFELNGEKYAAGSLLITRAGNDSIDFDQVVKQTAAALNRRLTAVQTGFVQNGPDFGSFDVHYIRSPRVLLVSGPAADAGAMGEVWHYFERVIGYPVTLVNYDDLYGTRLGEFNVIIFADGDYKDFPSDKLTEWVRDGGKLIAMQSAAAQLVDKKGFSIRKKADKKGDRDNPDSVALYGQRERDALSTSVPGAIYKMNLDNTDPLGYGFPGYYYTLKLDDDIYDYLGDGGWNVGTVKNDGYVAGFAGQKSKAKIKDGMLLGVQSLGRGTVVYLVDDPIFRSFWENGKLLFGNAVFMTGQQ